MEKYKLFLLETEGDIYDGFYITKKTAIDCLELDLKHPNYIHLETVIESLNNNDFTVLDPNSIKLEWEDDNYALVQSDGGDPLFSLEVD